MNELLQNAPVLFEPQEIDDYLNNKKGRIFVFIDEELEKLYEVQYSSPSYILYKIPSGEKSKSLDQVEDCLEFLISQEADKSDFILGIGGGVVTDITGLVSTIYKRGIPFAFMPTTLLAMVDASIGGKNGVNTKQVKNVIGTIALPEAILLNVDYLKTLPKLEWQNGFAEIIKHGFISSEDILEELGKNSIAEYRSNPSLIQDLVLKAMEVKLKVVEKDLLEQDDRVKLNFGHTFGHAFEVVEEVPHGYAVIKGMYWELKFWEETKNSIVAKEALTLLNTLTDHYYPLNKTINHKENIVKALKQDKKRQQSDVRMPYLTKLGESQVDTVSLDSLINFIYEH